MRPGAKKPVTFAVVTPAVASLAAILGVVAVRRRRRGRLPARALIVSPRNSTVFARDGAVRSVQSAELTVSADDLERLWSPTNLENLARTYWYFLSRVTLGLIRVIYGQGERRVVLLGRPLTLLRFAAPEYGLEADHGKVTWQIQGGMLVARTGRESGGFLALDVQRCPGVDENGQSKLLIEVEVSNFYPSIAASFSQLVYGATQSFIHVLVTHAFLRSLAKLELAESKVGRLSPPEPVGAPPP
ncbi:MAG: hypothetical protein M3Z06_06810 [Actinomycetota bacterium]|nr:hypothetical protein [Actinomycetota bacterium]